MFPDDAELPEFLPVLNYILANAMLIFGEGVTSGPKPSGMRMRQIEWIERRRGDRLERWELQADNDYHLVRDTAGD